MFERTKKAVSKALDAIRRFAGVTKTTMKVERFTVTPTPLAPLPRRTVKQRIPRASFRRSGPGITAKLRRALSFMTPEERLQARAKGWDRGLVNEDGSM